MNILAELETYINEFNQHSNEDFAIDTIRIEYSKQHKKTKLEELGRWKKINANDSKILAKLKKRLAVDEVTSAYQLENSNIYYYNSSNPPKYNKATMVIFGMKQYHKDPPPREIIENILSVLTFGTSKVSINLDVCLDLPYKPNMRYLEAFYSLKQYLYSTYINEPDITMIEKIVIYNKQMKNSLNFVIWRIEAKIIIPNIKILALPLYEFQELIQLVKINKQRAYYD